MRRRFSLFCFSLLWALGASTTFAAGGTSKDPKGEPRRDPRELREGLQRSRDEVSALKGQQFLLRQNVKFMLEQTRLVQSRLHEQLNVLYRPLDSADNRLNAMRDTAVPENSENWRSWIEISKTDSDPRVRDEAFRRAIKASPAYEVTRELSSEAQAALARIDPLTLIGHRRLRALGESLVTMHDTQFAARKLLEMFPHPIAFEGTPDEAVWIHILSHSELKESEIQVFDLVDFRDSAKATRDLRRVIDESRPNPDTRIASLARSLLAQVNPPSRGSVEALIRRHIETLPLAERDVLERCFEGLEADLKAEPVDIDKLRTAFDRVVKGTSTEIERRVARVVRELNNDLLDVKKWQDESPDEGMADTALNHELRRRIEVLSREEGSSDE